MVIIHWCVGFAIVGAIAVLGVIVVMLLVAMEEGLGRKTMGGGSGDVWKRGEEEGGMGSVMWKKVMWQVW